MKVVRSARMKMIRPDQVWIIECLHSERHHVLELVNGPSCLQCWSPWFCDKLVELVYLTSALLTDAFFYLWYAETSIARKSHARKSNVLYSSYRTLNNMVFFLIVMTLMYHFMRLHIFIHYFVAGSKWINSSYGSFRILCKYASHNQRFYICQSLVFIGTGCRGM